jgi:hypothetical protein
MKINVNTTIYGSLARICGGKYIAQVQAELPENAIVNDLLQHLDINPSDKSYLFINAVLCDMPGLNASSEEKLHDGDHVGIFSNGYMWPFQYRDGVHMSESLRITLLKTGVMHHTYTTTNKIKPET